MASALAFAFLDPPSRPAPDRRHSTEVSRMTSPALSRNSSTSSIHSYKSEPGWMASMNGLDRSRASSVPTQPSTKPSSGFGRLFGKHKKEKKDSEHLVLTSKHAAAVKSKLAHDPKYKKVRKEYVQRAGGTQSSLHITAEQLQMRHPHSGPPALYAPDEKADLSVLTRIISGDEEDEQDEWERLREQWRLRKIPTLKAMQVVEGEPVEAGGNTTRTPEEKDDDEMGIPASTVVEREGVKMLAVADLSLSSDGFKPRPERHHTPIGGRWKKDENGVWKR